MTRLASLRYMNHYDQKSLITYFPAQPCLEDLPKVIASPFSDVPHPLAYQATLMLQEQLNNHRQLRDFSAPLGGKMLGVLVVRDRVGKIGFLSAFSGMMNGLWQLDGFAPPIFNQAEQDTFLPKGKDKLEILSKQLQELEKNPNLSLLAQQIKQLKQQREHALMDLKKRHKQAKSIRQQQRQALQNKNDLDAKQAVMRALALESQHDKREATNAKLAWQEKLHILEQPLSMFEQDMHQIKQERMQLSHDLHAQVFASYVLHNFLGDKKIITDFFLAATPPAGAGDCALPKLIHYAQQHTFKPLAMAEFWWGSSPAAGVRHHGQFYPACRGKCRPILDFMLTGLDVDPEPYYGQDIAADEPKIMYEDDDLWVINKPAGLMSVPGKDIKDCVFNRLLQRYPEYPELRLVHRLDMSTSGLLVVAKNLRINKLLQKQFILRSVEKRYEAILSKRLDSDRVEGDIKLPLRVDLDDRPRQLVCYEHGKAALTHWQLMAYEGETSRVYFYPHTGRSHQLRVHASHKDGLNAPIVGDDLYGLAGERLMLHAQRLCFNQPRSGKRLEFECPTPF